MKIGLFIHSTGSKNWGTQATVAGLKHLLDQNYPGCQIVDVDLGRSSLARSRLGTRWFDWQLQRALQADRLDRVEHWLKISGMDLAFLSDIDALCFNGEGAVHRRSGHVVRILALLRVAKARGLKVAAVNQTIDFAQDSGVLKTLVSVYRELDYQSVREPVSFRLCHQAGLATVQCVPDAVYALPSLRLHFDQPRTKTICITGSSALKRNAKSVAYFQALTDQLNQHFPDYALIYLSNAKTDRYIFNALKRPASSSIVDSADTSFASANQLIGQAALLVGGRQHPNIFAYINRTPYAPLVGNSHKNTGVAELQSYPIHPFSFETGIDPLIQQCQRLLNGSDIDFQDLSFDDFPAFRCTLGVDQ